ncbi:MAG: hypothetical protein D9N13_13170 [Ketobacter sp. GenoA1]|nr:MAG: hypothetical protein D9N13_13170 [Ketobacter sp. GenoA1]RLT95884.1 MAG: hypothetical protein D9N15_13680 [Ketobacter sp.]
MIKICEILLVQESLKLGVVANQKSGQQYKREENDKAKACGQQNSLHNWLNRIHMIFSQIDKTLMSFMI